MSHPEDIFQKWVWTGIKEGKFGPEGNATVDSQGKDVFIGSINSGEDKIEIASLGPVIDTNGIPEVVIANMPGRRLEEIIILPSCGDDAIDRAVGRATIRDLERIDARMTLKIGI